MKSTSVATDTAETLPLQDTETSLERHRRKCSVCRHPDREEIEQEFLHWCEPWMLARAYGIEDYRSIYRHATALDLFERRRSKMRWALDSIIEQTPERVTADAVIRAIRAQTCLTDDGRWVEPATRVVITSAKVAAPPADLPDNQTPEPALDPDSNLRFCD